MLFAIIAEDHPDTLEKRLSVRKFHLQRLTELQQQNRLLTAGPVYDDKNPQPTIVGSLIIADFDCYDSVKIWVDNDPYFLAGVYAKVSIKPYNKVFPNE